MRICIFKVRRPSAAVRLTKDLAAFQCNFPCDARSSLTAGPTTLAVSASTPCRVRQGRPKASKLIGILPIVILKTSASTVALPRPYCGGGQEPILLLSSTSLTFRWLDMFATRHLYEVSSPSGNRP
jgi:hypothetical protein